MRITGFNDDRDPGIFLHVENALDELEVFVDGARFAAMVEINGNGDIKVWKTLSIGEFKTLFEVKNGEIVNHESN